MNHKCVLGCRVKFQQKNKYIYTKNLYKLSPGALVRRPCFFLVTRARIPVTLWISYKLHREILKSF